MSNMAAAPWTFSFCGDDMGNSCFLRIYGNICIYILYYIYIKYIYIYIYLIIIVYIYIYIYLYIYIYCTSSARASRLAEVAKGWEANEKPGEPMGTKPDLVSETIVCVNFLHIPFSWLSLLSSLLFDLHDLLFCLHFSSVFISLRSSENKSYNRVWTSKPPLITYNQPYRVVEDC